MKIANIIVAHKNPAQLKKMLSHYNSECFQNWVHLDYRIDTTTYKAIGEQPNNRFLAKRRKVAWAGNSFVKVVLESFDQILQDKAVKYINVMSGLDFPIKTAAEFYKLLNMSYENDRREYFDICELAQWPYNEKPIADRFERYHLSDWTIKGRYFTERIINNVLPRRKFYDGKMVPYGRSAWFTASREFCTYALQFFNDNPDYLRFLQYVWAPDEFAFSSVVMNSPFKDSIHQTNLRYIDWSEKKASPKTLTIADYDALLKSDRYIARKFDEGIDNQVINKLDDYLKSGNYN